jgi:hypothetical protein
VTEPETMKTKNQIRLEKVERQIARLQAKFKILNPERMRLESLVQAEKARDKLTPYIGQPVKMAYYDPKDPLREATGTLLTVKRTNCLVDFGPGKRWLFPFSDIIPATDERTVFCL